MAGVTTDVCMVAPAISALEEGFHVQVVCDACGSTNPIAGEMAWRGIGTRSIHLRNTDAMVAELVKNWASPAGAVAFPLLLLRHQHKRRPCVVVTSNRTRRGACLKNSMVWCNISTIDCAKGSNFSLSRSCGLNGYIPTE